LPARDVDSTDNFVAIDLDCGTDGLVTLISGYFKYREPTVIHVAALEGLLSNVSHKVLISLDANAFHRRWFSRISDARGETLVTGIDRNELELVNVRSPYTTFHGPRGRTNIDITLVDRSLRQKITGWSIEPGVTSSDHQLIRCTVELSRRIFFNRESRFVLKRRNHAKLRQVYEAMDDLRVTMQLDLDGYARDIEEDVSAAARLHAPRSRRHKKVTPPWWNSELQDARRLVRATARRRTTSGDRLSYNRARNAYTMLLRKNKIESWRHFCTHEGMQPWGRLYRWLKKGSKKCTALGMMTKPDGIQCQSIDESVELLLNTLIPNDPHAQGPTEQERTVCDLREFDVHSIKEFAWAISPDRAPGKDGITGKIVRALWPRLSQRLLGLTNMCIREARFPDI